MEDYQRKADELEREADELGEQGDKVEGEIKDAREDFDQKLSSQQAPGIADADAAAPGGPGGDEDAEDDEDDES